jgi:hypothetical protein
MRNLKRLCEYCCSLKTLSNPRFVVRLLEFAHSALEHFGEKVYSEFVRLFNMQRGENRSAMRPAHVGSRGQV